MRLATEILGVQSHAERADSAKFKRAGKAPHEITQSESKSRPPAREEYSALVARAANDAVRDWDVKTGELRWPAGLESLLGYKAEASAGELSFWQKRIHPEDRSRTAAAIREALLSKAENWSAEYRFRHADGAYLHLLERAAIVRDAEGVAVRFVGSLMDISARKQLHDQVCRSQKMEAFGQLAAGVAHDFNNFLTTILGYSDLLLAQVTPRTAVANHVGEIRDAASRASGLTSQLLAFSRRHPLAPKVVDVNTIVTNLERSLLRLLGENIAVECHLHRDKNQTHIRVDPDQLAQVILNLVVNARDAMGDGGCLRLETSPVTIARREIDDNEIDNLQPGEYVKLTVSDNGSGMSDEVKAHLFEPFFTTKSETNSSGLGLATTYGIVRQSGGDVAVESEAGRGTDVSIYFPLVAPPAAPNYKRAAAKKMPTGTERILVLEDDVSVRHISVRILRGLGYEVVEAANGDDAKRLIGASRERIDLLLTDVVMPQMSGRHFADWMHRTSPRTKVVFVSGYLDESLQPGERCDREILFLPKPFYPEQLATKIREALDGAH